jgi:hypothetical protein
MKYFGEGLSEKHKELNRIIRKKDKVELAKELFLEIHENLHLSSIYSGKTNEVDSLIVGLETSQYSIMPTNKDETIAWVLWHIARIEDLTMNILVAGQDQLFNEEWMVKMNSSITDTANVMSDEEIMEHSKNMNISELLHYRNAVGLRTKEIIQNLTATDLLRTISKQSLDKILSEGGVTKQQDSIWLLDFWGNKDVAGILLMPPTRHVMLHLNDCCKWKEMINTKKKFYLS